MDMNVIFQICVALAFMGVAVWAVRALAQYLPGPLPVIITVFIVLICCIWILNMIGGFGGDFGHIGHVGHPCG